MGPGTALKSVLHDLGINPGPGCDCHERAAQMDEWGIEGCEEHRAEITRWLYQKSAWGNLWTAAIGSIRSGLFKTINPFNVYGSLLDESLRRARESNDRNTV